jgi:hypothetical protein
MSNSGLSDTLYRQINEFKKPWKRLDLRQMEMKKINIKAYNYMVYLLHLDAMPLCQRMRGENKRLPEVIVASQENSSL